MRFTAALLGLALLSLALGVTYALAVSPDEILAGDAWHYEALGRGIADGDGYSTLTSVAEGDPEPTAQHPPLFPLLLGGLDLVGLTGFPAHRIALSVLVSIAVLLIGLLGRQVAGERAGLIAAALAAVYPIFVAMGGMAMTEPLYVALIALALLLACLTIERPTPAWSAALGAVIGFAALARPEALLLILLLVPVVAWRAPAHRVRTGLVAAGVSLLVLTPWIGRNWAAMDEFPLMSTNGGLTVMTTNCNAPYYVKVGFFDPGCATRCEAESADEITYSECGYRVAREYATDNLGRIPVVAVARVARVWNLYDPETDVNYAVAGGLDRRFGQAGVAMFLVLLVLAIAGAVLLRRRGGPLLVLLAPVVMVTVAAALTLGFSRYRAAADVAVLVLAAVALDGLIARLQVMRRESAGRPWRRRSASSATAASTTSEISAGWRKRM